jgi:hypothetical protein
MLGEPAAIVEGAIRWPYRDEILSAVASSVLPRSYSDSASKISGGGYVLLRIVCGPIVKLRPHARRGWLLLQCGQRSGGWIFENRGVA